MMSSIVIDVHTHPAFFEPICEDPNRVAFRRKIMGLPKNGKAPLQHIFNQMKCAGIDKLVLLPEDLTTTHGDTVVSNEEIHQLVQMAPDKFIGFASVDPHRKDALDVLEHAFGDLQLSGLKLHPSNQRFFPNDKALQPIYDICLKHNKPILFHSGLSWEPDSLSHFSQPILFEEVAYRNSELRFCLGHFGWPWVKEAAALLLKFPNVYADTGLLYFDSAQEFYQHVFTKELEITWIDRSLRNQIMFGSNNPRFEQIRMIRSLGNLGLRESTLERIKGKNALTFLGMEG